MKTKTAQKVQKRNSRHRRIRAKVAGTAERPRLVVFRSNKAIYAQLIDDDTAKTIASADSRKSKGTMTENAKEVGVDIAKKAKNAKITKVVFDRAGYQYTGSIATLAEAAREGGLEF